jgi:micrococcal nuclease
MRKALLAFLSIFFLSLASFAQQLVKVDSVLDGDTFRLENGEKVRLIGIDAPETHHPRKPVEYFGKEASAFAKKMLEGKLVRLELDVQERDQYGRLLAYVYLKDSTFVNAELVKQGYAQVATYPPNVKYVELFVKLQKEARENKRGLWKK